MEGLLGRTNAPDMEIRHIPGKGRGVFANETLLQGTYVAEYKTTIVYDQAKRAEHEEIYAMNGEACMVLEVQTQRGWKCLDATRKIGTVGRLFNHAPCGRATLKPQKPLLVRGKWRVAVWYQNVVELHMCAGVGPAYASLTPRNETILHMIPCEVGPSIVQGLCAGRCQ